MELVPAISYKLPQGLRQELAKAFGPVVAGAELRGVVKPDDLVIAVGDVVSLTCKEQGIEPKLFVVDYKTQRGGVSELYKRELGGWGEDELKVKNSAATITREAWLAIREGLARPGKVRIVVQGEEDLLGIPCFLEAPLGAKVLYGMPGKGVVVVTVDRTIQDTIVAVLAKFLAATH
jgi:uncharacterized protein (UPF0218 family)